MTAKSRNTLKPFLYQAVKPRQEQVIDDLLDSMVNKVDDNDYIYLAETPDADTVNDWRFYKDVNGLYLQYCTVAGATKNSGTWLTSFTFQKV